MRSGFDVESTAAEVDAAQSEFGAIGGWARTAQDQRRASAGVMVVVIVIVVVHGGVASRAAVVVVCARVILAIGVIWVLVLVADIKDGVGVTGVMP